ncbi:MAG: CocE/NonD family hydrolase [Myxococcota bacterium]
MLRVVTLSIPGLALVLLGCKPPPTEVVDPPTLHVRAGVEVATVLDAPPGEALTIFDSAGAERLTLLADDQGFAHFSYLPDTPLVLDTQGGLDFPIARGTVLEPGTYRIDSASGESTGPFRVLAVDDTPDPSLYDRQTLTGAHYSLLTGEEDDPQQGFQYIETRDGTLLSVMVRFPDRLIYGDGPFPTVLEYSGYSPSRPDRIGSGLRIANALGYAVVGVNMRGTGCSDGVFDVFNRAQAADGYDAIEVIARQPWVLNHQVGMVGISYPGISQLFVASTNPPSLAAIVPLSVIADAWEMQYPGGIYNDGFTQQWLDQRDAEASSQGTSWVGEQIASGDTVCEANQALSGQNIDFEAFFSQLEHRPAAAADRDLNVLVEQIALPVFLGGAWQDEQTGALFGGLTDHFVSSPHARFALYNGRHPDGFAPDVISQWFEFLELYVAERVPVLPPLLRTSLGGDAFGEEFGITGFAFADDRFTGLDYESALAQYESEPAVRVRFESGAGWPDAGAPVSTFERTYSQWPPVEASPIEWFPAEGGLLTGSAPSTSGEASFRFDPDAGDTTFFGPSGYSLLDPLWDLDWQPFADGAHATFTTEPFSTDRVLAGPAIAGLWVNSPVDDVSVQVSLSEVRPDGIEMHVQSGWLRLGHRAGERTGNLRIARTYSEADFEPVPVDAWTYAEVAIPSFAHPFRAGSALRMTVSTPGRNHGTWTFAAPDYTGVPEIRLGFGPDQQGSLTVAELPGPVPGELPPCPSLRGQPCRPDPY